jgi:hypothetical protein
MTPEEVQAALEQFRANPPAPPREVGKLNDRYEKPKREDNISELRAAFRRLTDDELQRVAGGIRRGRVERLYNDQVLVALIKWWLEP